MTTKQNWSVMFTATAKASLLEQPFEAKTLEPRQIAGRSVVSLISSGSERGGFLGEFPAESYPMATGYAAVLEVLETGPEVQEVAVGDIVFAGTPHTLFAVANESDVVKVLPGMSPEEAVLCRFPAVSMPSLLHTKIRPVEPVLVTGLGVVGLMCAQVFRVCGYEVHAVDPTPGRRETAKRCGIEHVYGTVEESPAAGRIGIAVECSGNEQATLDAVDAVRKGGEMALVGVPWYRGTDTFAHDLLRKIFYGFLTVRSGFEWSLPRHPSEFAPESTFRCFGRAMSWIREGSIKTEGVYRSVSPRECSLIYDEIAEGRSPTTATMFDWRGMD